MVNAIPDLPPIALASGTNFQPLFKQQSAESSDKKTKDVQKNADNVNSNKEVENKKKKETEKNIQADYSKLTEKLQQLVSYDNYYLEFSVDKDTKRTVVKVVDSKTKETIRQFPPETTLKIAKFVASTLDNGNVTNARI